VLWLNSKAFPPSLPPSGSQLWPVRSDYQPLPRPPSIVQSLSPHLCLSQNLVVAVSAEGWFHLFDLTPAKALDASGHHESLLGEEQRPVFKQHVPANTKVMLISDIGGHDWLCSGRESRTQWVLRSIPRGWGRGRACVHLYISL
jgi:hypothetical protein